MTECSCADFPSNLGETMAMDVLVGLHGQYRDQAKPFPQQIKTETVWALICDLVGDHGIVLVDWLVCLGVFGCVDVCMATGWVHGGLAD